MASKEEFLKEIAENPMMSDQTKLDISVTKCKFDIIEFCERYAKAAGGGVDRICVCCSWGKTKRESFSCAFFQRGHDIKMDHQLCGDIKPNQEDIQYISRLGDNYDAEAMKDIVIHFTPKEGCREGDYGWAYLMGRQLSTALNMLDISRLCDKYDAETPKEMKLFYNPEVRCLKTDYGWSYLLTEGRTQQDIMAKWLKEAEEGLKGV